MKAPRIIVTDLDDCLIDLLPTWVDTLNKRHNLSVKVEDIINWDIAQFFPTLSYLDVFSPLFEEDFWSKVQPIKGAIGTLDKLRADGHQVIICTATHHNIISNKLNQAFLPHFTWATNKNVIVCHHKHLISCDYLIDDNPKNLEKSKALRILMDKPHNRDCSRDCYDFRVHSWEEIYKLI